MSWRITLTGIVSGFLAGLLGVGGGIVTIFGLVTYAGIKQHAAHATSLATIPPIALVGAWLFASDGYVDVEAAWALVVGALAGIAVGTSLMVRIHEDVLRRALGVATLLIGLRLLLS